MTFSKGGGDDSRLRLDARVETDVPVIPFDGFMESSGKSRFAVCVRGDSSDEIPFAGSLDDILSVINVEKNNSNRRLTLVKSPLA